MSTDKLQARLRTAAANTTNLVMKALLLEAAQTLDDRDCEIVGLIDSMHDALVRADLAEQAFHELELVIAEADRRRSTQEHDRETLGPTATWIAPVPQPCPRCGAEMGHGAGLGKCSWCLMRESTS
jgi:hypothetical protein